MAEAQFNLGVCYTLGKGVEKDEVKVFEWWKKAAEQGDVRAQYIIGVWYDCGTVVKKDERKALEWYKKAANQGHQKACEEVERLQKKLS